MSAVENAGRVQGRSGWRRGVVGALLALGLGIGAALAPTASFAATQPDPQDSRAVYRFWSSKFTNAHFYTVSTSEAQGLYSGDPNWTYEGTDFRVWPVSGGACQANTVSVHRFWSSAFASHFYTTNGAEAEKVRTTDKNWKYEGVAFCTAKPGTAGTVPVHRFWSPKFKKHFYTANATEAQNLRTSDKNWTYEGVAIYAPASGPASPALTGAPAPKPAPSKPAPAPAPPKPAPAPAPAQPAPGPVAPSGDSCPSSAPIKGNQSSSGEWIYHVPGGSFYDRTNPEECFATESAAVAAGYRASKL
jgi:hypothetical protein